MSRKRRKQQPAGFWESFFGMLRDVLIASMNKGQFPIAILGLVLLSFVWRIPAETVGEIAERAFELIASGWLVGYLIGVMTLSGWFFHAKWQRRMIHSEMKRIAAERTRLQENLTRQSLGSSDK